MTVNLKGSNQVEIFCNKCGKVLEKIPPISIESPENLKEDGQICECCKNEKTKKPRQMIEHKIFR